MKDNNLLFGRLIPAMITPFDKHLNIDIERACELACNLAKRGADSILINATTGESPTISHPQKIALIKEVVNSIDGQIPVIAYSGNNCTEDSVRFSQELCNLDVDALLLVVPFYNKPPQEGIYQHFKTIANSVNCPCLLYNIPSRCGVNMTAETTLRLAHELDAIVGIKEASGDYKQIQEIIEGAPSGFAVYSGDDSATYDIMKMGGAGVISTIANIAPERMKEIVMQASTGNFKEAEQLHKKLLPLMEGLFATTNPILVKEALKLLGFPVGGVRLPLVDATEEESKTLAKILKNVGVIQ